MTDIDQTTQERPRGTWRPGHGGRKRESNHYIPTIIDALRSARIKRNYSQERLAKVLGYDRFTIGRWERGEMSPTFGSLLNWCDILGFELTLHNKSGATCSIAQRLISPIS